MIRWQYTVFNFILNEGFCYVPKGKMLIVFLQFVNVFDIPYIYNRLYLLDRSIGWLVDRLFDWSIDWLTDRSGQEIITNMETWFLEK